MTSNNLNEDNDSDTIFDNTNPTQFISDLNNNIKKNGTKAIKPRNILPAVKEKGPI